MVRMNMKLNFNTEIFLSILYDKKFTILNFGSGYDLMHSPSRICNYFRNTEMSFVKVCIYWHLLWTIPNDILSCISLARYFLLLTGNFSTSFDTSTPFRINKNSYFKKIGLAFPLTYSIFIVYKLLLKPCTPLGGL